MDLSDAAAVLQGIKDLVEIIDNSEQWDDKLRYVAEKRSVKFSPTEGVATEYDYRLVTFAPLVTQDDYGHDGLKNAYRMLRDLLGRLPRISIHPTSLEVPLKAAQDGGSGLRWDPATPEDDRSRYP